MREIKFRCYDEIGKAMYYKVWIENIKASVASQSDYLAWKWENGSCGVDNKKSKYTHIMQYTGLKDKNGKEIYEGDILNFKPMGNKTYAVGHVVWGNPTASWLLRQEFDGDYCSHRFEQSIDLEIIGNIYENPELITGGIK